jgi:hypothetical protein
MYAASACAALGEQLWSPELKTSSIQPNLDYSHMRYKRFFENLPKNQHLPRFCHIKTPFLLQQPKPTTNSLLKHPF